MPDERTDSPYISARSTVKLGDVLILQGISLGLERIKGAKQGTSSDKLLDWHASPEPRPCPPSRGESWVSKTRIGSIRDSRPRCEIHTATTWNDARTGLSERANDETEAYPDLLLLDLELPKTDGFAVLTELRDSSELPPLPILVLTASVDEAEIRRCYELHAAASLEKPHSFDELASLARMIKNFWIDQVRLPPA